MVAPTPLNGPDQKVLVGVDERWSAKMLLKLRQSGSSHKCPRDPIDLHATHVARGKSGASCNSCGAGGEVKKRI